MDSEFSPKQVELPRQIQIQPSFLRFFHIGASLDCDFWLFRYCFGFDIHHGDDINNNMKVCFLQEEYRGS